MKNESHNAAPDHGTLSNALRAAWSMCSAYTQELAFDAMEYDRAIADIAMLSGVPAALVHVRFRHYVAQQLHDWETCFTWFKSGDTEVWSAIRGEQ
jgi:hypothetical protein